MNNPTFTRDLDGSTASSSRWSRISWGAIFAGVAVALSTQLLLNLLGVGIGASTIDLRQGDTPGSGLALGAGIWFVVSTLLALYAGGWVAGRLAGAPFKKDGILHGITTWSVTTIATIALLTSAVGGLIGGSASLLSRAASLSSRGASSASPTVTNLLSQATGVTPGDVQQQAGDLVSDPRFQTFVSQTLNQGAVTPEARQSLVALVAQKQAISPEQANQEVSNWQTKLQQVTSQTRAAATTAVDKTASGLSQTALWGFAVLLLGALTAGFGGFVGAPSRALHSDGDSSFRPSIVEPLNQRDRFSVAQP